MLALFLVSCSEGIEDDCSPKTPEQACNAKTEFYIDIFPKMLKLTILQANAGIVFMQKKDGTNFI
jgi:hypothetical protein